MLLCRSTLRSKLKAMGSGALGLLMPVHGEMTGGFRNGLLPESCWLIFWLALARLCRRFVGVCCVACMTEATNGSSGGCWVTMGREMSEGLERKEGVCGPFMPSLRDQVDVT